MLRFYTIASNKFFILRIVFISYFILNKSFNYSAVVIFLFSSERDLGRAIIFAQITLSYTVVLTLSLVCTCCFDQIWRRLAKSLIFNVNYFKLKNKTG